MTTFNIYLIGVGGQGIGLLSEIILRAADHSGQSAVAVDTHGLAQRGGVVVSQIRLGIAAGTPLIPGHQADLVVSLERHEAMRGLDSAARPGGTLIYYDTVWQPLGVRTGEAAEISAEDLAAACQERQVRLVSVHDPDLTDARQQNMRVLKTIHQEGLVPGISQADYLQAMDDLMTGGMLASNRKLFLD
ncbi:MAG: 2-oxoacid:acceptor oxidoreductase family protein [Desulfosarcinaceae bacterium]|nr:2-oxoacid:acceptor oxidoreductase family protein [Desulfosarcinaceae bacterium]